MEQIYLPPEMIIHIMNYVEPIFHAYCLYFVSRQFHEISAQLLREIDIKFKLSDLKDFIVRYFNEESKKTIFGEFGIEIDEFRIKEAACKIGNLSLFKRFYIYGDFNNHSYFLTCATSDKSFDCFKYIIENEKDRYMIKTIDKLWPAIENNSFKCLKYLCEVVKTPITKFEYDIAQEYNRIEMLEYFDSLKNK